MVSLAGGARDRLGHAVAAHFFQPLADPPQAQTTESRREALGEVLVAEQAEDQRGIGTVQQLDRASRFDHIGLVQTELTLQDVDGGVCVPSRLGGEMRGTVRQQPRAQERRTDPVFSIAAGWRRHGRHLTR